MARLVAWFKHSLKKRPVLTNTAVYATFYTAAEISQQSYNKIYLTEKPDLAAAARIVCVGSSLYAPTLYYWYRYLDNKFYGTAIKTVATKVFLDQFAMTPVLMATFFTLLGVLERKEDIFEELKHKYWKAFLANQFFWIPSQTVNFFYIPPTFRVVYVATVSFLWINVMCFIKRQKIVKTAVSENTQTISKPIEDENTQTISKPTESENMETTLKPTVSEESEYIETNFKPTESENMEMTSETDLKSTESENMETTTEPTVSEDSEEIKTNLQPTESE